MRKKTMGIIALALATATADGRLESLPGWLSFLRSAVRSRGTTSQLPGGSKLFGPGDGRRNHGRRLENYQNARSVFWSACSPVNPGFAAETSSACIIGVASYFGIPVSTTHKNSRIHHGRGGCEAIQALKWTVIERMVWAWLLTIPVSGTIAYFLMRLLRTFGVPTAG